MRELGTISRPCFWALAVLLLGQGGVSLGSKTQSTFTASGGTMATKLVFAAQPPWHKPHSAIDKLQQPLFPMMDEDEPSTSRANILPFILPVTCVLAVFEDKQRS